MSSIGVTWSVVQRKVKELIPYEKIREPPQKRL
jgi:hypothetical protein